LRSKPHKFLPLFGLLAAFVGGCVTATVPHPVVADLSSNDDDTQIEFWHTLATKPVACNDDAFHAILLDLDGTDPNPDYDHRVAALKSRKLLLSDFDKPAHEAVTRGVVAVALYKAGNIHGGVVLTLFGPSERYCLRELRYINLLPPSSPNQTFSGLELVGVIGRFEDYIRGNPADLPASEMPPAAPNFRANPQLIKQSAQPQS
jgi:hypothetical protein